jgi:uncharacterized membrane protein
MMPGVVFFPLPAVRVSPIAINGSPVTLTAILNIPNSAVPGGYSSNILVNCAANGAPSTSLALPLNVAQDYTIENLSPTTQTITAGQSITYNLSVAPLGTAYSNTVTLSCAGAPLFNGTCALSRTPLGR